MGNAIGRDILALSVPHELDRVDGRVREVWRRELCRDDPRRGTVPWKNVLDVYSWGEFPRPNDSRLVGAVGGLVVACVASRRYPLDRGLVALMRSAVAAQVPIFMDTSLLNVAPQGMGLEFDDADVTTLRVIGNPMPEWKAQIIDGLKGMDE